MLVNLLVMDKGIRILDASLNRGREGLRVVEDVARFVLDDMDLASQIKAMRHKVTSLARQLLPDELELLSARDSEGDVGADLSCASENCRLNLSQIATANLRRVQEATRVLEEVSKLYDVGAATQFKELRFQLYGLEKEIAPKLIKYQSQSECGDPECRSQDG